MKKISKKNRRTKNPRINIRSLFMNLQKEMITSLSTTQKHIPHAPSKGSATEFDWKEWLSKYLPERYTVEKAFILDLNGQISDEIDLVIFDRTYSPFLLHHKNSYYIPVESVYAAFEIKPKLNKQNIEYAAKKASSIRCLCRTSGLITCIDGARKRQELKPILFGILCTSSSWKPPIVNKLKKISNGFQDNNRIDIGCCIDTGAFIIIYENEGEKIFESHEYDTLLFFFFNLFDRLQQYGNAPALDSEEYIKALKIQR